MQEAVIDVRGDAGSDFAAHHRDDRNRHAIGNWPTNFRLRAGLESVDRVGCAAHGDEDFPAICLELQVVSVANLAKVILEVDDDASVADGDVR